MVIDKNKMIKGFLLTMLFGGLVVGLVYSIKMYYDTDKKLNDLENQVQAGKTLSTEGVEPMVARLSAHMILPEEAPKVIPVTNVEYLKKEQPFFSAASEGDVIVVYSNKVILYNPLLDKIVEVAQIRPEEDSLSPDSTINASPSSILE